MSGVPDTWPLSALDAARAAGVSERTIRRAIARGELRARKHGGVYQISPDDLADYRARKGIGVPSRPAAHARAPGLPRPPTPMIGREVERASVRSLLLDEGIGILTLTGPGGVGKTRLALHLAAELAGAFDDGAFFVDLSPVRDPDRVLPRIARTIGVRAHGRRDISEAVTSYLRARQVLLVLDNCEQVLAAAPAIAELLAACPALQVLATSRAPLRLRGERQLAVHPFPVPLPDVSPDDLAGADAIRLFLDRARAVSPAFAPSTDQVRAIAGICRRLDGLPLAIELAAARSAVLSPGTLLERLSDRLGVLTDGPRDLPDRQRTMRDAIAWSYDLLSANEQALFRRLAVFVDGFDLDAALAIAGDSPANVLSGIGALVEQSLVRRAEQVGDGERFVLLETVREFAWMRLRERGELDVVRGLHADHYLNLAEHIESVLYGSEMRHWLDRFEIEYPNCLAALGHFVETGDATLELRLAGMLSEYWYYRGQIADGIAAREGALARGADAPPGPRARGMSELGFLVKAAGDTERALALLAASVPLARQTGDIWRLAQIRFMWADVLRHLEGRETEAIALLEEVIELVASHESAVDLYAAALDDLGELWLMRGNRERGVALVNRALTLFQGAANQLGIAQTHLRLGRLARREGKTRRAADHYGRSLRANLETRIMTHVGLPLAELSILARTAGYAEPAARIAGMVQAVTDRTGAAFADELASAQPGGEREMPGHTVREAFEAGRALPFDDALSEAIAVADALATGRTPPGAATQRTPLAPVRLSARERDVLVLLAQRYTAPEMADQLYLSVRTVERHVANLYNKLGVNSRRAATAVAVRHGLV